MLAIVALLGIRPTIVYGSSVIVSNNYRRSVLLNPRRPLTGNVRGTAQVEARVNHMNAYRVRGVSQRRNNNGTWENTIGHTAWHRYGIDLIIPLLDRLDSIERLNL